MPYGHLLILQGVVAEPLSLLFANILNSKKLLIKIFLKDCYAIHALYPRPKGRGFTASCGKAPPLFALIPTLTSP